MKITVDRNMPLAPEAFATLGDVHVVDGRNLQAADIKDTTILAIRSTTKVTPALLDGSAVRFVGTATIGTDHLDIPYLEAHGIEWVYAPGCNAQSVAEYLTAALLHLGMLNDQPLVGQTLGIIGVGNVGRRVARQAAALGMRVLLNDPPRARTEGPKDFCDLETILTEADFISVHVPLAKTGPDATYHLLNQQRIASMQPGTCLINAARGPIVDTPALIEALDAGRIRAAVLDTWEGEPVIPQPLLKRVAIGTPHIAGHSFEGKANGTLMVYEAACRFLSQHPQFDAAPHMPKPDCPTIPCPTQGPTQQQLHTLIKQIYDLAADDARLRAAPPTAEAFDSLRRKYPIRREFACTTVTHIPNPQLAQQIKALGFATKQ